MSVGALLRVSSIGFAPYQRNTLISLPNKPFEYMAAGLPILSSLRGELEELITKEQIGLAYRAGDEESLAQQILWFIEHPEERLAMGVRARRLFERRYDAALVYAKLAQHLEHVLFEHNA